MLSCPARLSWRAKKKSSPIMSAEFVIRVEIFAYKLLWDWIWEYFCTNELNQTDDVAVTKSLTTLGGESDILAGGRGCPP